MGHQGNDFVRVFMDGHSSTRSVDTEPEPPGAAGATPEAGTATPEGPLDEQVIHKLKGIFDPEIPVNIYDLGLIYRVDVDAQSFVKVQMTLTTPGCPVAQTFPGMVEQAVASVAGVRGAEVELVWDPPWTQERMIEAALLQLGIL